MTLCKYLLYICKIQPSGVEYKLVNQFYEGVLNMFEPIEYTQLPNDILFIDVRSPSEYQQATIEGAINVPILSDEERKVIGTMYKQNSHDAAKIKGVEYVSKKLPTLFKQLIDLKRNHKRPLALFCARGGYRSTSLAFFLNGMGERVFLLKGATRPTENTSWKA